MIDAKAHSERAGLQLVDVIAYSFFKSVEKNTYGLVDTSYVSKFKNNTYSFSSVYIGNGVKIIPNIDRLPEKERPNELIDIFKK